MYHPLATMYSNIHSSENQHKDIKLIHKFFWCDFIFNTIKYQFGVTFALFWTKKCQNCSFEWPLFENHLPITYLCNIWSITVQNCCNKEQFSRVSYMFWVTLTFPKDKGAMISHETVYHGNIMLRFDSRYFTLYCSSVFLIQINLNHLIWH